MIKSLLALLLVGCSSSSSGGTIEDAGIDAPLDAPLEDAGTDAPIVPLCSGVTGTYLVTGARTADTGSCPGTLDYPSSTATLSDTLEITNSLDCVFNVNDCSVTATCHMYATDPLVDWTADLSWIVSDHGFYGSESWTEYTGTEPSCTANWVVQGVKQ